MHVVSSEPSIWKGLVLKAVEWKVRLSEISQRASGGGGASMSQATLGEDLAWVSVHQCEPPKWPLKRLVVRTKTLRSRFL